MKKYQIVAALIIVLVANTSTKLLAQKNAFINDFPTPEEVVNKIKGNNELETYTMQTGAIWCLQSIIDKLARAQGGRTNEVEKLKAIYRQASSDLYDSYQQNVGNIDYKEWYRLCRGYESSLRIKVETELLGYNAQNLLAAYGNKKTEESRKFNEEKINNQKEEIAYGETIAEQERQDRKITNLAWLLCIGSAFAGKLLMAKAISTRRRLAKYEFDNRSPDGVVLFATFEDSVKHNRQKIFATYTFNAGGLLLIIGVCGIINMS